MPSTSQAQARLMAMIAHGKQPSHLGHKPPSAAVAKEFSAADKGKKLSRLPARAKGSKLSARQQGHALRKGSSAPMEENV